MCSLQALGNVFFNLNDSKYKSVHVCVCQFESEFEHAFFSSPLAGTIACGEVLRCSQSREQCEGRRVLQQEVVHARALSGGNVKRHNWNQVKCLACQNPIWLPAKENRPKETQKGRKWRIMFTVQRSGMSSWEGHRWASGADWIRATGSKWPKSQALTSLLGVERWGWEAETSASLG